MKVSEFLSETMQKVLQELADDLLEQSVQALQHWQPVGDIRREASGGYVIYEELGKRPNVIESTATVIDDTQKALPAPRAQEGSEAGE